MHNSAYQMSIISLQSPHWL